MSVKQRITTFLWFDNQAEEAAKHYVSIFRKSRILTLSRYGETGPGPKGTVMTVGFELDGQEFAALNGGPHFKFSEAVSLVVSCETQAEVDEYWATLSAGGAKGRCGWLKDKYGLSWQIVPTALMKLVRDKDAARADRVMAALLTMTRLDIAALQRAYDGK